ncbi:MAG: hypothetical protein ACOCZK_05080 [Planctomycetota bacterium]
MYVVAPADKHIAFEILEKSTRCFCHIPIEELVYWARRRYVDGEPTTALLANAPSQRDRELICVIALLDVDAERLNKAIGHLAKPGCRLEACRRQLRAWLAEVETPAANA